MNRSGDVGRWTSGMLAVALLCGCGGRVDDGAQQTTAELAGRAHVRVRFEITANMTRKNSTDSANATDLDVISAAAAVPNTQYGGVLNCSLGRVYTEARPGYSEFPSLLKNCDDNALVSLVNGTKNQPLAISLQVPYDRSLRVGFRLDNVDTTPYVDQEYAVTNFVGSMLQDAGTLVGTVQSLQVVGAVMQVAGDFIKNANTNDTNSCAGSLLPDPDNAMIVDFSSGEVLLADGGTPQTRDWDFTGPVSDVHCGPNRSQTHVRLIVEHDPTYRTKVHNEGPWRPVSGMAGNVGPLGAAPDGNGQVRVIAAVGGNAVSSSISDQNWGSWDQATFNVGTSPGLAAYFNHKVVGKPVVVRDHAGNINAFLFDSGGVIGVATQTSAASDLWTPTTWFPLPTKRVFLNQVAVPFAAPPGVGQRPDGGLEAFATGTDGRTWINYQGGDLTSWSGWQPFGTPPPGAAGQPTVNVNKGGGLEVYVRANDGSIWGRAKPTQYGAWGDWFTMGGNSAFDPVLARNWDGRIEIFTVAAADHRLCHKWQTPTQPWSGPDWSCDFGGYCTSRPAVTNGNDGELHVFVRGGEGNLWQLYQTFDAAIWSGWQNLGGNVDVSTGVDALTAVNNADGSVEVLFRNAADGTLNGTWQTQP